MGVSPPPRMFDRGMARDTARFLASGFAILVTALRAAGKKGLGYRGLQKNHHQQKRAGDKTDEHGKYAGKQQDRCQDYPVSEPVRQMTCQVDGGESRYPGKPDQGVQHSFRQIVFHLQIGGKDRENPGSQGDAYGYQKQEYPVFRYGGKKPDAGKIGRGSAVVGTLIGKQKEQRRAEGRDSGSAENSPPAEYGGHEGGEYGGQNEGRVGSHLVKGECPGPESVGNNPGNRRKTGSMVQTVGVAQQPHEQVKQREACYRGQEKQADSRHQGTA
nr:hypothetical protein [Marispirochaeta aestuarii]